MTEDGCATNSATPWMPLSAPRPSIMRLMRRRATMRDRLVEAVDDARRGRDLEALVDAGEESGGPI